MDHLKSLEPIEAAVTGATAEPTARRLATRHASSRTPNRWLILATMTGALSMVMIDQTVVSVALPTMQRDLGLSTTGVQWVVNAYLLLLAVLVAFGGRVADLFGAERTFRAGASLFVLASALCGLAQNETMIIARPRPAGSGGGDDDAVDRGGHRQHVRHPRTGQGDGHLHAGSRWCSWRSGRSWAAC